VITTSQRRRIVELSEQGMTTPQLCAHFGVSRFAIRRVLREHGVKAQRSERRSSPVEEPLRATVAAILRLFEEECGEPNEPLGSEIVAVSGRMFRAMVDGTEPPEVRRHPDSWMLWRRLAIQTGGGETFRPYPWKRIAWDAGLTADRVERAAARVRRALWRMPEAGLLVRLAYPPEKAALREESHEGESWQPSGASGRVPLWERLLWRIALADLRRQGFSIEAGMARMKLTSPHE
jgi:hypothetical protein